MVHQNLGNAKSYADCFELLQQFDYIDQELAQILKAMAGLRNILVHEYITVDLDQLYDMLNHLDDFSVFAESIGRHFTDD